MTTRHASDIATVTRFWRDHGPEAWFRKDEGFDGKFRSLCDALHWRAARRELDAWNSSGEGALALLLLLDQFPRNCFRGTGHMYATDPLARHHARQAVAAGYDQQVEPEVRLFFYLPYIHSEQLADQDEGVEFYRPLGEDALKHAIGHRDIVARFGRFPHRNHILGRETTPDEQKFLDDGGFAG